MQLSETELSAIQHTLRNYEPSEAAIAALLDNAGDLDASLEELLRVQMGQAVMGQQSLKQVTLEVIREQLCGDEGFREKLKEYTKNAESTPLLTSAIVYLASQIALPFPINPALATLIVLYLSKLTLEIYCRYTEPEQ